MLISIPDSTVEEARERDARWTQWVARGREDDRILQRRARGTVVALAAGFVVATVWTLWIR